MEILGIGIPEILFILLIALIVMGPEDLSKAGLTLGRWMRNLVQSDTWKMLKNTSREIQTLPNRLMREANLEDLESLGKDIQSIQQDLGTWTGGGLHTNRNLAGNLLKSAAVLEKAASGGGDASAPAAAGTAEASQPETPSSESTSTSSDEESPSA